MPFDSLVFKIPHSQMNSHLAAGKVNYRKRVSRKSAMQGAINEFESFCSDLKCYCTIATCRIISRRRCVPISPERPLLLTRPQEVEVYAAVYKASQFAAGGNFIGDYASASGNFAANFAGWGSSHASRVRPALRLCYCIQRKLPEITDAPTTSPTTLPSASPSTSPTKNPSRSPSASPSARLSGVTNDIVCCFGVD